MAGETEHRKRLGVDFGKLWAAGAATNVADGVVMAAGPLLVARLTDDPRLIAGAVFAQQLPWLLLVLVSGVFVDRLDRRVLIAVVNLLRGVVIGGLALAIALDAATVPLVYAAFFLVGAAETLADTATSAMVPVLVDKELLPRANARISAVHVVANQLLAPPVGAALFVVGAALPFGLNAAAFILAGLAVFLIRHRPEPRVVERKAIRHEIAQAVRWLWAHNLLRTIAVTVCFMNILFMFTFAILVVYAKERLGMGEVGFGALLTASAVGGLLGTALVERWRVRFGEALLLRVGMVVETLTHVALALTTSAWVAVPVLVVFGVHAAVMGVVLLSVRQRIVPDELRGRVGSVYFLLVIGGTSIGSLASGVLAAWLGTTGPLWAGGAGMALLTALVWRRYTAEAFRTA